jgi:SWI/SNF chromatin-remodeling complex subunit SWI1
MNDPSSVPNSNGGPFGGSMDPNAAAQGMMDPSFMQFQQPNLYSQGIPNGNSPGGAFQPGFQVNPIIPAKRPRPREDSLGASPGMTAGALPNSRSHTPQQFQGQGFPNSQPQFPQGAAYQHLQNAPSSNATPSPIMQNQPFRPPSVSSAPKRVQTASPNPFSPAIPNFERNQSPYSNNVPRVNTPQSSAPGNAQNNAYSSPYAPQFAPPQGGTPGGGPVNMPPQAQNLHQQQQYKMMMQARQQQQQQQQMMQQGGMMPNQSPGNMMQGAPRGMMSQAPPSQRRPPQAGGKQATPQEVNFLKQIMSHAQKDGRSINLSPVVAGRQISLYQLFGVVSQNGSSKKVTASNQWPNIAMALGFNPQQFPSAPHEISQHFKMNLEAYEVEWQAMQMQRKQQQMESQAGAQGGQQPQFSSQMSPTRPGTMPNHAPQPQTPHAPQASPGPRQPTPGQTTPAPNVRHNSANGFMTPQAGQVQAKQNNSFHQQRQSMGRPSDIATPQANQPPFNGPSAGQSAKSIGFPAESPQLPGSQTTKAPPKRKQIPSEFLPKVRVLNTHGGLNVGVLEDTASQLLAVKPNVPSFIELGVIDIHALTMSLRSGLHGEVRLALDTLATISIEHRFQLQLESCEDLVETLVDCAEDQVELLAEHAAEVSDDMQVSSYEDVIKGCRLESESLQDVPEFGSLDYDLDRAVDRVICVTTILRNLSFFEMNHNLLADAIVVKFLSNVLRYLGTRNMLFRTNANTLDFMKDMIIYLSNLSQAIELPGKDEALLLLHFLLAFAPQSPSTAGSGDKLVFAPYSPAVHRYLPPAVDSLAKLLARDEPNRKYYRAIFAADVSSTPPYELLTRTFGLAISPIPDTSQRTSMIQTVEARKPYLMQGMLAAEVLANLAPGHESGVARSWLCSEDGFSASLLRLVSTLSSHVNPAAQRHPQQGRMAAEDLQSYFPITYRGTAVLTKLAEKARNADDAKAELPSGIFPSKESLIGMLLHRNIDRDIVKQLCAYAGLDS